MKYLVNEKGHATIYFLWLLGIVAVIFVLTINIVKVYIVKEHANLAVEQAALAGTAVLLDRTKKAVEEFDTSPTTDLLYIDDRNYQRFLDDGKGVGELIEEKQSDYISSGMDEANAYIKAANQILPIRIDRHPYLKKELRYTLGYSSSDAYYIFSSAVQDIINQNKAKTDETEVKFTGLWQIEVKSAVKFESISDHKFIPLYTDKIYQKGYGPALTYLGYVYS